MSKKLRAQLFGRIVLLHCIGDHIRITYHNITLIIVGGGLIVEKYRTKQISL